MMENSRSGNRTWAEGAKNKKGVKTEQEKKIMWVINNLYPRPLIILLADISNFIQIFATQLRKTTSLDKGLRKYVIEAYGENSPSC